MGLLDVEGQAVKLYEEGETLFNDKESKCEWHLDYKNKIGCEDITEILVNTEVIATDIETDGVFEEGEQGTNTFVSALKLWDGAGDFTNTVEVGMVARNMSTGNLALVTSIPANNEIILDTDIFPITPVDYNVSWYETTGGMVVDMDTGQLIQSNGTAGTCKQYPFEEKNNLFKVEIDVVQFISGTNGQKVQFKIGGLTVFELDETVQNTGTFTMFGYNTDTDFTEFEITCDADLDVTFDNLKISQYSNSLFYVIDDSDNSIVYYSEFVDSLISQTQDQMKMSFDWSNVDCGGCYFIAILQDISNPETIADDRIVNGDFATDTDWTKGAHWSISGGSASVSWGSNVGDLTQDLSAYRANLYSSGICYDITVEISNYGTGEFQLELSGGASPFSILSDPISGNGTHVWTTGILANTWTTLTIKPTTTGAQIYDLDNITAIMNIPCTGFKFRTDVYTVSDSFDCCVKLSGFNNDVAFGIDFVGLNYNPKIVVDGELNFAFFDGEKINEEDSLGNSENLYFKSEKKRNLFLSDLPEHLHNFIRLLIGYDRFLIDEVEYISLDAAYEPVAERVSGKLPDLASVTKEVRKKEDLNKNRFC
jgi:hypothetical protein